MHHETRMPTKEPAKTTGSIADINDEKVLESTKDKNFMKAIIAEVKELSENKELNPPILQDWILLSA